MVKVTFIYAGHQLDYLLGLISGLAKNSNAKVSLIDGKRVAKATLHSKNIELKPYLTSKKNNLILEMWRWSIYYTKLTIHLLLTDNNIIHVEWINRKIDFFEHYYFVWIKRLTNKKLVFKIHDLDTNILLSPNHDYKRTLKKSTMYFFKNCDQLFVHNEFVKKNIQEQGIDKGKIKLMKPWHGVNSVPPKTSISKKDAQSLLGLRSVKTILFFGNLRAYKGIVELLNICSELDKKNLDFQLILAGKNDLPNKKFQNTVSNKIKELTNKGKLFYFPEFIKNNEVEIFFKASDLLVLPYKFIYQSGLPFLSYYFGVPILSSDVGGLKEDIVQNHLGLSVNMNKFEISLELFLKDQIKFWETEKIESYTKEVFDWNKVITDYIKNYEQL